jgi:hypothetical protein
MNCPICFDPIETHMNCMVTECGHHFHTNCMLKHVSMGNHGCPLCRSTMVNNNEDDEETIAEDDEDEDEDDEDEDEDDEDEFDYADLDIRNDPEQRDDYIVRGFRWLFLQYPSEEDDFSMFDGNSMAITPNSLKRASSRVNQIKDEDAIDEQYEETLEEMWNNVMKEEEKLTVHISEMESTLKKENVSYNDLLTSYMCALYPKDYYFYEMYSLMEKKTDKIHREKLNHFRQDRTVDSRMTIDELM